MKTTEIKTLLKRVELFNEFRDTFLKWISTWILEIDTERDRFLKHEVDIKTTLHYILYNTKLFNLYLEKYL